MEAEFIQWLREHLPPHAQLMLGVGDDAAVLRMAGPQCVVTSDLLTDQVDFHLQQCDPRRIGRKALAVNLSDLAAMASRPVAAVVSLALPRRGAGRLAIELYEGLMPLAEQFDVAIAGGDTNTWDGRLVISVTAIGEATGQGVVTRAGALAGDTVLVTGAFGGSILGRHFEFQPRVAEAMALHARCRLHAATDVSDGLLLDLSHLCQASGCGAVLELDQIPIAPDAFELARTTGGPVSALDHALGDGEDFELVLAVAREDGERLVRQPPPGVRLTRIGRFSAERGLWQRRPDGSRDPLERRGYQHRAEP